MRHDYPVDMEMDELYISVTRGFFHQEAQALALLTWFLVPLFHDFLVQFKLPDHHFGFDVRAFEAEKQLWRDGAEPRALPPVQLERVSPP